MPRSGDGCWATVRNFALLIKEAVTRSTAGQEMHSGPAPEIVPWTDMMEAVACTG